MLEEYHTIALEATALLESEYASLARGTAQVSSGCFGAFAVHCAFYLFLSGA